MVQSRALSNQANNTAVTGQGRVAALPNPIQVDSTGSSVTVAGTVAVSSLPTSTTMTITQVTVPATVNGILLLAANVNRKGFFIQNLGLGTMWISSQSTGLTALNGFEIAAGVTWGINNPIYTGAVYGILGSGTQTINVMELT